MGNGTRRVVGLLIGIALLGGCLSRGGAPAPKEPMDSWLYNTQGLVGVFPPREDVRVGDVHLYLSDPDDGRHVPLYQSPRWSYLPSSELLRAGLKLRPEYPATPAEYLRMEVSPHDRNWPESTGEPGFLEPGAPMDRLRSIQLPPFAHYRTEPGERPPSWGLHDSIEETFDDWSVVRVQVESAETTSLPLEDAVRAYLERRDSRFYLPASLRQNLRALAPEGLRTVWVRIVSQVIYMRAMRVTVVAEESDYYPLYDDVSPAELGEDEVDPEVATEGLDPAYAAIARAHALNRKMVESGTDALPDSFLRYISVSDEATSARRVFRRPIAIGVGGLSLRVDARTGEVEELRLMGRGFGIAALLGGESDEARALDAEPIVETPDPGSELEPENPAEPDTE
jgi:hypothetical protein